MSSSLWICRHISHFTCFVDTRPWPTLLKLDFSIKFLMSFISKHFLFYLMTLKRVAVRYLMHNEVFKLIDSFWTEALMC